MTKRNVIAKEQHDSGRNGRPSMLAGEREGHAVHGTRWATFAHFCRFRAPTSGPINGFARVCGGFIAPQRSFEGKTLRIPLT